MASATSSEWNYSSEVQSWEDLKVLVNKRILEWTVPITLYTAINEVCKQQWIKLWTKQVLQNCPGNQGELCCIFFLANQVEHVAWTIWFKHILFITTW